MDLQGNFRDRYIWVHAVWFGKLRMHHTCLGKDLGTCCCDKRDPADTRNHCDILGGNLEDPQTLVADKSSVQRSRLLGKYCWVRRGSVCTDPIQPGL